ncbi:MAG TPA: hypothetical protein VMO75_00785, partial [Chthoniobacterales bacterium]|nr:hypothetical protein [Chthoniobacterales bacterium]
NRPQFSVVGEDWLSGTAEPDRISYFVVPNYPRNTLTASRITDLRYVRLTNEGPRPLMVDFLAVEISKDGKNWNPTTLIDISNGQLFFPNVKEGLKKCLRVKLDKPELKTMTFDKNIGSGETVKGWLCIARPTGSGFDMTKWRIRIRDNKGEQGISEVTGVGKRSDNETFSGTGLTFNENDDLTGIQFTFYNQ